MENFVELNPILNFLIYFVSGTAYLCLFIWIYLKLTPYDDFKLIHDGNSAAAISLSGAVLGMCLPLVRAIEQSSNLGDLFVWAMVSLVVQVIVYLVIKKIFPNLVKQIPHGRNGEAIFLAAMSITFGLLTSACMAG